MVLCYQDRSLSNGGCMESTLKIPQSSVLKDAEQECREDSRRQKEEDALQENLLIFRDNEDRPGS
jgi:hypothetical protein